MAAEGPLHELGAIGIVNSDSQGMGRIGETLRRTLQLAHAMKAWRASQEWDEPAPVRRLRVAQVATKFAAGAGRITLLGALALDPEKYETTIFAGEGGTLRAAASRAAPVGSLRRTFHEARCALEAQALSGEANGDNSPQLLATFRDLGSFQLLLSLQDDDALRLFCDSILAPIEDGEGAYGGELMRSLEAFIECNGQWERAARQLYCHRHTLRYRIRRVEELTGRSLDSARDRIDFWLALRGRELIGH